MHDDTKQLLEAILKETLTTTFLLVQNDGHRHATHKEAKKHPKAGHFKLEIASPMFLGKSHVECHRMIYQALNELIPSKIHALAITIRPV